MADLYCSRAISGTFEVQDSYFAMKSSHSGMPILSPLVDAVVVVVGFVDFSEVVDELLLLLLMFSDLEQANSPTARTKDTTNKVILRIECFSLSI